MKEKSPVVHVCVEVLPPSLGVIVISTDVLAFVDVEIVPLTKT